MEDRCIGPSHVRPLGVHGMQGFEFVFYGDSITERWRGSEMGRQRKAATACKESFQQLFGKWRTALLAISGTTH